MGQDTELDTSPRRVGMDWAVKMDKPDFLGKRSLERTADLPDERRLLGFTMPGPAPVEGSVILVGRRGRRRGDVQLRLPRPRSRRAARVAAPAPAAGDQADGELTVEIDGRTATVAETPFFDPSGARARA